MTAPSAAAAPVAAVPAPRGTARFFALALGFTWLLQLPAALARLGWIAGPAERFLPLIALGAFGPVLAAVLESRRAVGGPGVRALFRSLGAWRVGAGWYLVALGGFALIYITGRALYVVCGGSPAVPWLYPPENGAHVAAAVLFPLVEEPGWRGFALPRLQQRHGALAASLLLGVGWALWHTTMFLVAGLTPALFLLSVVNIVAGSVVFSWFYNRTRGSLLLAVLAHVGAHLNNPSHALPANPTPFVCYTAAMVAAACALVFVDRGAWRGARDARARW